MLARRAELVVDDPETLTLPKPDLAGLLVYCRAQIKAGTLVARGGIWRSGEFSLPLPQRPTES